MKRTMNRSDGNVFEAEQDLPVLILLWISSMSICHSVCMNPGVSQITNDGRCGTPERGSQFASPSHLQEDILRSVT